jgi:hypothetical protein
MGFVQREEEDVYMYDEWENVRVKLLLVLN